MLYSAHLHNPLHPRRASKCPPKPTKGGVWRRLALITQVCTLWHSASVRFRLLFIFVEFYPLRIQYSLLPHSSILFNGVHVLLCMLLLFFWYAGVTTDKENKRVSCAAVVASCVAFPRNVRLEFFKCYEEYHFFILFYRSTYLHILYMYWHIESYLHRNLEQIQRLSFDARVSPTSNEFTIAHRIGRKKAEALQSSPFFQERENAPFFS